MLKVRIIPILTFNGFGLVKTKQFKNPRMVGNPVQAARVYNSRGVDELVFLDIFASEQNRKINLKIVGDVIKECFMPVAIGGGIKSVEDINNLLKIGADKVVVKTIALTNPEKIVEFVNFFGSQCITIAIDAVKTNDMYTIYNRLGIEITVDDFMQQMIKAGAGEFIINSVDNDGMMQGFDHQLISQILERTSLPVIAVGGGGHMEHYQKLFENTQIEAVGSASIYHFTQFTPLDIKFQLQKIGKPVRIN